MACRIPILRFEQWCNTEATIGFVLRIAATFARFLSFLILTSSSRTCSSTQKVSRISVFRSLYCFQLIRRQILHFSNIQCCPVLNRLLFPICVTESRTVSFLGTNTNSQSSVIGWTTGQVFRCFSKIQPLLIHRWPNQTDLNLVASIKLRLPSPVFRLTLI